MDNKPLWKVRVGGVEATAWINNVKLPSGETAERIAVTLDKRYRDQNGSWQSTNSLGLHDLMKAEVAIRQAIDRVVEHERGEAA